MAFRSANEALYGLGPQGAVRSLMAGISPCSDAMTSQHAATLHVQSAACLRLCIGSNNPHLGVVLAGFQASSWHDLSQVSQHAQAHSPRAWHFWHERCTEGQCYALPAGLAMVFKQQLLEICCLRLMGDNTHATKKQDVLWQMQQLLMQ